MAAERNGKSKLVSDLKNNTFSSLYIISGNESYLKEYYLQQLRDKVVDPTFRDFNLVELDGQNLAPEALTEAVDSYPAMAEKKLIVVTDFDLYKPPAAFAEVLPALLADLPPYVCLVFYYDLLEGKPDKRTKLYKIIDKAACLAVFDHLEEHDLIAWLQRRFRALNCTISNETCSYMIFLCGNSMTNLIGEVEKAAAFCTTGEVTSYHIDAVCSRVLEAVVFDLTDAITAGNFSKAVSLVDDLIRQRNNEVMIFTVIARHIQRLYGAKLCEGRGESALMRVIGSSSPYYAKRIRRDAQRIDLDWLRNAAIVCARTDTELKGSAVEKQKQIELAILEMASGGEVR